MADPVYRSDIDALAAELRRIHGGQACQFAIETVRRHLQAAAWKHVALWLQVANHLTRQPATP